MFKTVRRVILSVVLLTGCCVLAFIVLFFAMIAGIGAAYDRIGPLKLGEIPDGVYTGKGGSFIVSAKLEVTVENHKITEIEISRQICSGTHKAPETVTRILESQEARVDAVSGATWTSRSLMTAAYDALDGLS